MRKCKRDKLNKLREEFFRQKLEFTTRLADLEAARANVPEDEMEDWLLDRTEEELRMLADPEQFLTKFKEPANAN